MSTTWKIHTMGRGTDDTVLRDERDLLEATISVCDFDHVLVKVEPAAGSRANANHARAEAARVFAMIYDTIGDHESDCARDPRESPLQVSAELLYPLGGGLLRVVRRDALCTLLPCFYGVVDTLMSRYF